MNVRGCVRPRLLSPSVCYLVLCHPFMIAAINLLDSMKNLSILGRPESANQYMLIHGRPISLAHFTRKDRGAELG